VRVLIAEDDPVSRYLLEATLKNWGCDVTATEDGNEAWRCIQEPDSPRLILLDWNMPGVDGAEICRRVRVGSDLLPRHIILLTAREDKKDILEGLRAGADDYVTKPFDPEILHARLQAGERIVALQVCMASHVRQLERALARVKELHGLLPICSYCKKIRDDQNYWTQVEAYISNHTDVQFSHGICPDCYENIVKPMLSELPVATPPGDPPGSER
jgi:sigma-B regulation protein RsbU (phosphoserine phosphatase)